MDRVVIVCLATRLNLLCALYWDGYNRGFIVALLACRAPAWLKFSLATVIGNMKEM
jgi:hypothetical protein